MFDKKEYNRRYRQEHREETREKARKWTQENPERKRLVTEKANQRVRIETLTYYGQGKLSCIKCGFSDILALTLDHINGDGNKHRRRDKKIAMGGVPLYYQLRKQGYPKGYQTLCMNCQFIKERQNGEHWTFRLKEADISRVR